MVGVEMAAAAAAKCGEAAAVVGMEACGKETGMTLLIRLELLGAESFWYRLSG